MIIRKQSLSVNTLRLSAFKTEGLAGKRLAMTGTCLIFSFICICSLASAQTPKQVPSKPVAMSGSEIVSKMVLMNQERAAALKTYTSQRTYELDYSGFPSHKHAKMVVDVTFNSPNEKQLKIVSEEGSELLRNRVLRKLVEGEQEASERSNKTATALTEANYEFTLSGSEQKDGRNCYVLNVKPRTKSKFLYDGKIWVDSEDFAVVHIEAQPAKNPSFWIKRVDIEHQYAKLGAFWLPVNNRSASSTRLGGHAVLSINYGPYQVEPGTSSPAHRSLVEPPVNANQGQQQSNQPEAASDSELRANELAMQLTSR